MSNGVIAFLFSAGLAGWVYAKTMRSTGNNTQTSLIVAAAAALVAFLFFITILGFIPSE